MALARRKYEPSLSQRTGDAESLRQQVARELRKLYKLMLERGDEILEAATSAGAGAPATAQYVVTALDGTLTADRLLTAGAGITVTDGGANGPVTVASTITQVTDEHIQDVVGAMILGGTGISAVYSDPGGTVTISTSVTQYTDEMARDAIGAALVAGAGVTVTVNDGADTITIASTITQYTDELARDAIGAALVAGPGASVTVNDGGDTITISAAGLPGTTLYEVNFAALANNTMANGVEVIDGFNWTAANVASLGTFEILNGTGLRMLAGTSLGTAATYNTTTRNAPNIEIPLSSFGFDGRFDVLIEIYIPTLTLELSGDGVFVALHGVNANPHGSSTERVRETALFNNGGTRCLQVITASTATNGTESVAGVTVIALRVGPSGIGSAAMGVYSGGWPSALTCTATHAADAQPLNSYVHPDVRLVLGLRVVNDSSPTTAAVIERMRISRAA